MFPDRQSLIDYLLDRYEHPKHRGTLEGEGVASHSGGNPGCGDVVTVHVRPETVPVDEDPEEAVRATVEEMRFEGEGCTISQACADIALSLAEGKTVEEVRAMTIHDLYDHIGREMVMSRVKCAVLGLDVLRQAVERWERNRTRRGMGLEPEKGPEAPDMRGVPGGPDPFSGREEE